MDNKNEEIFQTTAQQPTGPAIMFVNDPPQFIKFIKESGMIFIASAIYAVFYTFCMYKNSHGITAPVWIAGTIVYLYVCLSRLEMLSDNKKKKSFAMYGIGEMLLGFNLCMTTDTVLIVLDTTGIFLLVIASLLHIAYDDSEWGFGKYFKEIINSFVMAMFYHGFFFFIDLKDRKEFEENVNEKSGAGKLVGYIALGAVIALPILCIVVALLASADKFFADLVGKLFDFDNFDFIQDTFCIALMIFASLVVTYGLLRLVNAREVSAEPARNKVNSIIGITINVMIGIVYFAFSFIQIYYLFLGNLTIAEGYTYAEYAREGFFQLVVVCAINMIIVLLCLSIFENTKGLKGVLAFICACTYIMIASSTLRMYMYVSAYNFTYTRVFVFLTLFIIFMIMNGIVVYIFKSSFKLFKYSMVVVAVCYMVFAYSKPCYWIAAVNMSKMYSNTEDIDIRYITHHLGTDAAPAIQEYGRRFNKYGQDEIEYYFDSYTEDTGIRGFNFSQARYESIAKKYN